MTGQRVAKSKGKLEEQQIASLDDLGFVWDVHDHFWEQGITRLRQYRAEHGHVVVPWRYETSEGFKLGDWALRQRVAKSKGKLDEQQIASLDDLGFVWDVYGHLWKQGITRLRQYRSEHGHVLVLRSYKTSDGFKLGNWVNAKRVAKSQGKLDEQQIASLDDLGFIWEVNDHLWEQGITRLRQYKAEHGHVLVHVGYKTFDGFRLGSWVNGKRVTKSKGKLDEQQIASLDDLGFVWDVHDHFWEQGITRLRQYRAYHGHVFVLRGYETSEGFKLGDWALRQRVAKSKGKLDEQQIASLDDLGFVWDVYGHLWEHGITRLREYRSEHGHVLVLRGYKTSDGFKLGHWVNAKRVAKSKGNLDEQQIASLDDLGFVWDVHDHLWEQGINRLRRYKAEHGHVILPADYETSDGFKLGRWVARKRQACSRGTLKPAQMQCLEDFGFKLGI